MFLQTPRLSVWSLFQTIQPSPLWRSNHWTREIQWTNRKNIGADSTENTEDFIPAGEGGKEWKGQAFPQRN
jgi:hypothetical protein